MFKHTTASQLTILIVLSVMVFSLAVIVTGAWSLNIHANQSDNLSVVNKTKAFQVVNVTVANNTLSLELKNVSYKYINGYTLSVGEGTIVTDYTISDYTIAPGEIEGKSIPLDNSTPSLKQSISVDAVVFTDNSSEGELNASEYIKNRRRGVKLQLQRVLPLLRNILSTTDADMSMKLKDAKMKILEFPEHSPDIASKAISDGLRDAKQDALLLIERLEQEQANGRTNKGEEIRKEIANKVSEHEKRFLKL